MAASMTDFDDVLEAFAVDLAFDLSDIDADEIYHRALEEGLITEAQLDASFDRLIDRVMHEAAAEALDPIAELCRLVADAGGEVTLYGHAVTEAELRIEAAQAGTARVIAAVKKGLRP